MLGDMLRQCVTYIINNLNTPGRDVVRWNHTVAALRDAAREPTFDFETTPDMECDENDFAGTLAQHLHHKWEDNGIGSYEFHGQRGTHRNWQPELVGDGVRVKIPANAITIWNKVSGTYEGGGCPGEDAPHHSCGHDCETVRIKFTATLFEVVSVKNYCVAWYSVEQEN